MFTCVDKNGTRLEVVVSLNYTLFYCVSNGFKGLLHKTKRSHRVKHVLQITARASMCMNPTDCYVFFSVQISKPSKILIVQTKLIFKARFTLSNLIIRNLLHVWKLFSN